MLRKISAVFALAMGVAMFGCGGDACDRLDELCNNCQDLTVRASCETQREAALLLPLGATDACQAAINSGDFDECEE